MKAILFVLFTDYESFSHSSSSPGVDECTYVLGRFCRDLVMRGSLSFDSREFVDALKSFAREQRFPLDVDAVVAVLLENNILVEVLNGKY